MKRLLIRLFIFINKVYLGLFYNKRYLTGRFFDSYYYTSGWEIARRFCISQKIKGFNKSVPWPCNPNSFVVKPENIDFDIDYIDNFFNFGCYYQAIGKIHIGKRTQIAPNVGIITANHNLYDIDKHVEPKDVYIGDDCWIGMNSMILSGVILGNHTVVGAGSVVTHSFEDGNCVVAGNPAKIIKRLEIK